MSISFVNNERHLYPDLLAYIREGTGSVVQAGIGVLGNGGGLSILINYILYLSKAFLILL